MRIQMITTMAGPDGVVMAGKKIDLPKDKADELVAGGYAIELETPVVAPAAMDEPQADVPAEPKTKEPIDFADCDDEELAVYAQLAGLGKQITKRETIIKKLTEMNFQP